MSTVKQAPSLCERLIAERLDVTDGRLEPSDGYVIVEVPWFVDVQEFVRGSINGVHWIARLESVRRRRDGWDVEFKVEELKR